MRLGPAAVADAVNGVEGGHLVDDVATLGGVEVEDVKAATAPTEATAGADKEATNVEAAEPHCLPFEARPKRRHRLSLRRRKEIAFNRLKNPENRSSSSQLSFPIDSPLPLSRFVAETSFVGFFFVVLSRNKKH